jgi:hypothetical protein
VNAVITPEVCGQATGCRQTPGGPYSLYDDDGNKISDREARRLILSGAAIEDPNAGAGSYADLCWRLGLGDPQVLDWTSSAGNWCFHTEAGILVQEHRYPRHGYRYYIGDPE